MEIDPARQKTRPDFEVTEQLWGVRAVDVRDVTKRGRKLFYRRDGVETPIARIYNRVIPDELDEIRPDAAVRLPRRSRRRVDRRAGLVLPHQQVLDSVAAAPVGAADALPQQDRRPAARSRRVADQAAVLVRRRRHHLRADRRDFAAIPPDRRALYVLQERVAFTPVIETPHGPTQGRNPHHVRARRRRLSRGDAARAHGPRQDDGRRLQQGPGLGGRVGRAHRVGLMPGIRSGFVTALYLFDVAEAIDLHAVKARLGARASVATLDDKSAGPSRLRYIQPPVVAAGEALGCQQLDGFHVRVKFYDYGVVSLTLTKTFAGSWAELVGVGPDADRERAARAARRRRVPADRLDDGRGVARPAQRVSRRGLPRLCGHVARRAADLRGARRAARRRHRAAPARRAPAAQPAGAGRRAAPCGCRIWPTTSSCPRGTPRSSTMRCRRCSQAIEILEFANSQLLEFRYHDELLESELTRIYAELQTAALDRSDLRPPVHEAPRASCTRSSST